VTIPEISKELALSDHFLVTSHINPDGDAIGSLLAMTSLLRGMGKDVTPVLQDEVPRRYSFLPGVEDILTPEKAAQKGPFEILLILDAGHTERIGKVVEILPEDYKLMIIDHHIKEDFAGESYYIDSNASATAELVFEVYEELGVEISEETAMALYTGIMTDTGRFRFQNTTAKAFKISAALLEKGINPSGITKQVFYSNPVETVETLSKVLGRIELSPDGKIATTFITSEEAKIDHEGFVNHLISIEGVEVAIFLRPLEENLYKGSFRSTGDVNVSEIASTFGGGGHAKAAGGKISGTLDEVKKKVVSACATALKKIQAS